MPLRAGLAGAARAGLGGGGVAGLNPALTQQGLANRNATAGGVQGLSAAGGGMGGYSANLAALQVRWHALLPLLMPLVPLLLRGGV
jgi:hypothetical protein